MSSLKVVAGGSASAAVANNIADLVSDRVASRIAAKISPFGVKMPKQSLQFVSDG